MNWSYFMKENIRDIIIKFYECERHYTKETAKKFLIKRFMETDNLKFIEKLTELMNGQKVIELGGI